METHLVLIGQLNCKWAIFNSYVELPKGINHVKNPDALCMENVGQNSIHGTYKKEHVLERV